MRTNHPFQILLALLMTASPPLPAQAAINLDALWDFKQPAVSEQRFVQALTTAEGDDALILQTQIARSHGLRRNFAKAREVLAAIDAQIKTAGPQARVRHALELGRTHASATHTKDELAAKPEAARKAFQQALDIALQHKLDGLAIDAIHMFAFVDTAPAEQLRWGQKALSVVKASDQAAAKRWEASIQNNIGFALHQLSRFDEALQHFKEAVTLREASGNAQRTREAHWMVAWTLRALKRDDEALAIQERLERENDAANTPDPYVFEELELLHKAKNNNAQAAHYANRLAATKQKLE